MSSPYLGKNSIPFAAGFMGALLLGHPHAFRSNNIKKAGSCYFQSELISFDG
jgi:hypothetical protein